MNNKIGRLISLLIIPAFLLGACNLPSQNLENPQTNDSTAAAQTVEALLASTSIPGTAAGTTTAQATASITPLPMPTTLTPSPSPLASETPTVTVTTNCNVAQFVADVTIPDGTVVLVGQSFTKKWRIKNAGSCTWSGFNLLFDNGDLMGGAASKGINTLGPGQEIDLEVTLTAPATPGSYRGYWRIQTNAGVQVPVINGYQGKSFYVDVRAQTPAVVFTSTFTPVAASATPSLTITPNAQVTLNAVPNESGTLQEPAAGVESEVKAGDTNTNGISKGFLSFDISSLSGKTINSAVLIFAGCSANQDPFQSSLGGIKVLDVQYAVPLDQTDYAINGGEIIKLNSMPSPLDVKSFLQVRTSSNAARFQILLMPAGTSNNDNVVDNMTCTAGSVTLKVDYKP